MGKIWAAGVGAAHRPSFAAAYAAVNTIAVPRTKPKTGQSTKLSASPRTSEQVNTLAPPRATHHATRSAPPISKRLSCFASGATGLGVFATRDLLEWEVVGVDRATIWCEYSGAIAATALAAKVPSAAWLRAHRYTQQDRSSVALAKAAQALGVPVDLPTAGQDEEVHHIVNMYQYQWKQGEKNCAGLFPVLCMLNHSCDPNCAMLLEGPESTLVALRAVKAGEELTVSYLRFITAHPALRLNGAIVLGDMMGGPCKCGSALCVSTADLGFPRDVTAAMDRADINTLYAGFARTAYDGAESKGKDDVLRAILVVIAERLHAVGNDARTSLDPAVLAAMVQRAARADGVFARSGAVRLELALLLHKVAPGTRLFANLRPELLLRFAAL